MGGLYCVWKSVNQDWMVKWFEWHLKWFESTKCRKKTLKILSLCEDHSRFSNGLIYGKITLESWWTLGLLASACPMQRFGLIWCQFNVTKSWHSINQILHSWGCDTPQGMLQRTWYAMGYVIWGTHRVCDASHGTVCTIGYGVSYGEGSVPLGTGCDTSVPLETWCATGWVRGVPQGMWCTTGNNEQWTWVQYTTYITG